MAALGASAIEAMAIEVEGAGSAGVAEATGGEVAAGDLAAWAATGRSESAAIGLTAIESAPRRGRHRHVTFLVRYASHKGQRSRRRDIARS